MIETQTEVVHLEAPVTPLPPLPLETVRAMKRSAASRRAAAQRKPVRRYGLKALPRKARPVETKRARAAGHKAQTQVDIAVWRLIQKDARAKGLRDADQIRNIIYRHYRFKPA